MDGPDALKQAQTALLAAIERCKTRTANSTGGVTYTPTKELQEAILVLLADAIERREHS